MLPLTVANSQSTLGHRTRPEGRRGTGLLERGGRRECRRVRARWAGASEALRERLGGTVPSTLCPLTRKVRNAIPAATMQA